MTALVVIGGRIAPTGGAPTGWLSGEEITQFLSERLARLGVGRLELFLGRLDLEVDRLDGGAEEIPAAVFTFRPAGAEQGRREKQKAGNENPEVPHTSDSTRQCRAGQEAGGCGGAPPCSRASIGDTLPQENKGGADLPPLYFISELSLSSGRDIRRRPSGGLHGAWTCSP
jgi:hypothetical protein